MQIFLLYLIILVDAGIDHGSRFARLLGFYEETAWVGQVGDEDGEAVAHRKKKKNKGKKSRRKVCAYVYKIIIRCVYLYLNSVYVYVIVKIYSYV